jgi:hypothetical protein
VEPRHGPTAAIVLGNDEKAAGHLRAIAALKIGAGERASIEDALRQVADRVDKSRQWLDVWRPIPHATRNDRHSDGHGRQCMDGPRTLVGYGVRLKRRVQLGHRYAPRWFHRAALATASTVGADSQAGVSRRTGRGHRQRVLLAVVR